MTLSMVPSRYKDQPAVTLETALIRAQFLPASGAKMASLVYKPTGTELLLQRPGAAYRHAPYAGGYVEQGECSGFDEMFPTIDNCAYGRYPWTGTAIPDHGEVWSLPWEYRVEEDALHFHVHGVRFPYQLEKWVKSPAPGSLYSHYRLTNLSDFDLDFLWAAHMMLNLEDEAVLTLPAGVRQIVTAVRFNGSLGEPGDLFDWPVATLPDGRRRDLRQMRPKTARDAVKYFVNGRMPEGWCALSYPRSGLTLRLKFPVESVPYLALLPDEGGWDDLYSLFVEPVTAAYDRLDVAQQRGACATVPGRATYEWHLEIELTAVP